MTESKTNKPAAELRGPGGIKAVIWANPLADGKTMYNTTFARSFKQGEDWRESSSFGPRDLLPLAKLASEADTRIRQLQAESRQSTDTDAAATHPAPSPSTHTGRQRARQRG